MARSKFRNQKNSISYSDRNKKEYMQVTYPKLKERARETIAVLKNMKKVNAAKYIEVEDNYGGIPRWLDLVSSINGWEFKETMPSVRNCGYSQADYNKR